MPDRTAETIADWLRSHPGVEIASRDRGGAYAEGIRQGAPDAVQVADRFHLLKNLGDALEAFLLRKHAVMRQAVQAMQAAQAASTTRESGAQLPLGPLNGADAVPTHDDLRAIQATFEHAINESSGSLLRESGQKSFVSTRPPSTSSTLSPPLDAAERSSSVWVDRLSTIPLAQPVRSG